MLRAQPSFPSSTSEVGVGGPLARWANMETSWSLHVGDVQTGQGYPGWQACNPVIPHAKW